MTPSTVHLMATLIRHNRGVVTAIEKWISDQPPSELGQELGQVLAVQRGILTMVEKQISAYRVGQPEGVGVRR